MKSVPTLRQEQAVDRIAHSEDTGLAASMAA